MTMPSDKTIQRVLKDLRRICVKSEDPMESRIAQAMECAIVWARRETVGWPAMKHEPKKFADILREDMKKQTLMLSRPAKMP